MTASVATVQRPGQRGAAALLLFAQPGLVLGYQVSSENLARALAPHQFGLSWFAAAAGIPWTWSMLAFDIASLATWIAVLSAFPLGVAFSLTSVSYVLVTAAAWIVFHEPLHWLQVLGGAVILAGVSMLTQIDQPEPKT